jgi:hypothetical protein
LCGLGGSTVRLRTGTKRLRLPDEFNPTKIYQAIAGDPRTGNGEEALDILASIFENRGQLDRAADYLKQSREEYGEKDDRSKTKRLDQILGAWGEFVGTRPQPAGRAASVDFRFRNGRRVHFEAHEILFDKLLQDVKDYSSSRPLTSIVEPKPAERTKATEEDRRLVPQREPNILDRELAVPPMVVEADRQLAPVLADCALDEKKIDIDDIGSRLVAGNEQQYLGRAVARWDLDLEPSTGHLDKRITVTTPLQRAGAYLVTGRIDGGNISRIVVWLDDTLIVQKSLTN